MSSSKTIVALALSAIALINGLSLFLAFSNFKANQGYIEKSYCENLTETDFDCGGQCYFMKKMRAAENAEDATSNGKFNWVFQPLFLSNFTPFKAAIEFQEIERYSFVPSGLSSFTSGIFRPPQV